MASQEYPPAVAQGSEFSECAMAFSQGPARPAFLVTVDTECDDAWSRKRTVTMANAEFIPRFQALCESYGLKPTYFTNFEMAASPVFQEFGSDVLKRGAAEIGMHLHAWNSPPILPLTADDQIYHPYLIEFPEAVIRRKVAFMTDLLENTFGRKMTSHRAGRWGFNEIYARILVEHGYTADCSITPLTSWAAHLGDPKQRGGPDYSRFPLLPYFLDLDDISRPGGSPLMEIPVTAMQLRPLAVQNFDLRLRKGSFASRALNRAFPARCLMTPMRGNLGVIVRVLRKTIEVGRPCVHFALHSSNLMPKGSPVFRDERELEVFYDHLHSLFSTAMYHCRAVTVSEFRNERSEVQSATAA
jgi:hypothetical protein